MNLKEVLNESIDAVIAEIHETTEFLNSTVPAPTHYLALVRLQHQVALLESLRSAQFSCKEIIKRSLPL